jgi:hypothetical protein
VASAGIGYQAIQYYNGVCIPGMYALLVVVDGV